MPIRKFIILLPTFILFLLIFFNLKEYTVWQQILDGFNGDSISLYLDDVVSHTARLILMHPIVVFANSTGIDENRVFSYVVLVIFLIINLRVTCWTRMNFGFVRYIKVSFLINLILLLFFLLMNGRNAFSFLGNALLFDAFCIIYLGNRHLYSLVLAMLAGFFCNVSSGTFAVLSINLFLHFIIVFAKRPLSKLSLYSIGFLACGVGVYLPVLLAGFYKNLEFYDYSIVKMLSHGYGDMFIRNIYLLVVLAPLGLFLLVWLFLFFIRINLSKFRHIRTIFFLTACVGGLFGYSSLVGALPVLLFLIATLLWSGSNKIFVFNNV